MLGFWGLTLLGTTLHLGDRALRRSTDYVVREATTGKSTWQSLFGGQILRRIAHINPAFLERWKDIIQNEQVEVLRAALVATLERNIGTNSVAVIVQELD